MVKKRRTLGILGGTFDPIHYGHMVAAECARDAFDLDEVVFIPAAIPPHKLGQEIADGRHRLHMVRMAVNSDPHFSASGVELDREGPSYTVDTVEYFLRDASVEKLYFILGVDALLLFNTWKDVDRLVDMCEFIVVSRPGYDLNRDSEAFRQVTPLMWSKVRTLNIPGLHISSSDIRKRIARGETVKYLIPSPVEEYILEHGLYVKKDDGDDR